MSSLDKNKIFFGLIHYILSEQSNVDWILKTSLVNFTGINSTIENQQFQQTSLTDDIIEYIYQIKPYHVQFEQFIEKYSSDKDEVHVSTREQTDLEIQVRFDAVTSEVDEQGDMSDEEYINTHMANRLWHYKHSELKDMYDDNYIKDYIKDVLNCHFKGITVDGYQFNIDTVGYDNFLYDATLYDAPTLTVDYCLLDYTEDGLNCPYEKTFVTVGTDSLLLPDLIEDAEVEVKLKHKDDKDYTIITEYSIKDKIMTLFKEMRYLDKVVVTVTSETGRHAYVFSSHYFTENEGDTNSRRIAQVGTTTFQIPFDTSINIGKLIVYVENENGSRFPTNNYKKIGNELEVFDDRLKENCHLIINSVDTRHIYDKIYTYEDCYGQSNNLVTLDGNEFLRPYYEKERPSELCVAYPYNNLMVFETTDDNMYKSLRNTDHKDAHYELAINTSLSTILLEDLILPGISTISNDDDIITENVKEIVVESLGKLILPKTDNNGKIIPGKVLINSEIIEFYDCEEKDGKGILKSIRRATNGSYFNQKHQAGSIVYALNDNAKKDLSSQSAHTRIVVKDSSKNEYRILGSTFESENIEVLGKSFITLLSDVTVDGTRFDITSDNVQFPGNVELVSENEYSTVYANQTIGINVGGEDYQIKITKDYLTLDSFVKFISQKVSSINGFMIMNNLDSNGKATNRVKFIASNGRYIKLYNIKGEPVQQLFGIMTRSSSDNLSVTKDGYNGLLINGYKVVWGNDKASLSYLQNQNPEIIGIDEIVATINGIDVVNKIVKAYNHNGLLVIVPLINENIIIHNLSKPDDIQDNVKLLGIENITVPTYTYKDKYNFGCYGSDVKKMGYVFIDGDKVPFKNIEKIVNGETIAYRISNYITSKEYKANEALIIENQFKPLSDNLYTINVYKNGEDAFGTITFNKPLLKDEIYVVSNVK